MHNKVVYHAVKALHGFGLPVLRFNFRGTGLSEGSHDHGRGERDDIRAALDWLEHNVRGESWGVYRCEKLKDGNYSLHSEGRAIDWHLDAHDPAQRAEAVRLIDLFLAPDKLGNPFALARRMGVQGLIFNCRAWWGGPTLVPYSPCYDKKGKPVTIDDTTAHRNHVHIELNWAGARMQTSFWKSR